MIDTLRFPEAAFYAKTFAPSHIMRIVNLWKQALLKAWKPKLAESIADPHSFENLFPDYQLALDIEKIFEGIKGGGAPSSLAFKTFADFDTVDVISGIVYKRELIFRDQEWEKDCSSVWAIDICYH